MLTRCLLILASVCLLSSCSRGELVVNPRTPCGDPELARLYFERNNISAEEESKLDSLIARCLETRPCDHPRIGEIIMQDRELTAAEYRELYMLADDCDNWKQVGPISTWGWIGIAYAAVSVVSWTIGLRLLSGG